MEDDKFIEAIFKIAFGESAIKKGYTKEQVITQIKEFSNKALDAETESYDEHDDRDYDAEDEALYGNPTEPPTSGQSQWWIDPETGEPRYN